VTGFSEERTAYILGINVNVFHSFSFYKRKVRSNTIRIQYIVLGVRGGAVGSGTALQTGRSRVRFPMESLELFSDLILPVALWS
jgi:hypothetical protein